MKKPLFFLLSLAFSTMLSAQQTPRIEQLGGQKRLETYVNQLGNDSAQFTISGQKDTILRASFAQNGHLWRQEWKDSAYVYDVFGQLRSVYYADAEKKELYRWQAEARTYDFDGSLARQTIKTATGAWHNKEYNRKNAFVSNLYAVNTPSVSYTLKTDSLGRKQRATKTEMLQVGKDSISVYSDTLFYDNGQIFHVSVRTFQISNYKSKLLEDKYYAKNGALLIEVLPDSLTLIPFKDNVDCYYGLKNQRGDTIYAPRFDQIKELSSQLWAIEEGSKTRMMRKDGKIVSSIDMENVYYLQANKDHQGMESNNYDDVSDYSVSQTMQIYPTYFGFQKGKKHGIVDRNGTQILPPQYQRFSRFDATGSFFEIIVTDSTDKYDVGKRRVVDREGKFLFNNRYPHVELTGLSGFFRFSPVQKGDTSRWQYVGLADKSGNVLLDTLYSEIAANQQNHLFWVYKGEKNVEFGWKNFKNKLCGLFDPIKKQWVLPCVYQMIENGYDNKHIVLTDSRTKKQGIVSNSGQLILPFVYDTIISKPQDGIWVVAQNGRYQLYDIVKGIFGKNVYQCLARATIRNPDFIQSVSPYAYEIDFFIAQKNNQWGLINLNEAEIAPFTADYAGYTDNFNIVVLVKGNKATMFSEWLFPLPDADGKIKKPGLLIRPNGLPFNLVGDKTGKVFSVNKTNRVLYPPQYRVVQQMPNWTLLENEEDERLLVFNNTEISTPFPYKKQLFWASPHTSLVILGNKDDKTIEVIDLKTQQKIRAINSGAISADEQTGTFFVKTDTLVINHKLTWNEIPQVCPDTFNVEDTNWTMFDAAAKPLTVNALRYPIKFVQGVGIGAVGDKFGVWRADGTTIAPPQYKNARFVADYKRIVLYQNIGLKNWLQLIEPQTGKTLIGTGRYDGISEFYTDYALVSLGEKIGLVDTNGREIVAPISLQNDAYNLMDSLNKASKRSEQHLMGYTDFEGFNPFQEMPINISRNYMSPPDLGDTSLESTSPDSLNLPNALRNRVWHYLLETQVERVIKRADVSKIERAEAFKTYNSYKVYRQVSDYKSPTNTLRHLFADSLYIAFALVSDSAAKSIFKNYWQTKTGWQPKQLSDILNLNRDNILKINDLMRQKIKQLENKDIDCGESTSFVERAENAFLAHAKGISFYFTSSKNNYGDNQMSYVPILLTWAELKAFRTPQ